MNEDKLKQAYERMSPDVQAEKRILNRILIKGDSYMDKKFTSQPVKSSRWAVLPAAMALIAVIALGVFVVSRFGQNNQSMNSPDHKDQNWEVQAQDATKDPDEEQTSNPNVGQEHEPMTLPEYGQPIGGCTPEDTKPVIPLPETLNIDNLDNSMVAISLDKESIIACAGGVYPAEMKVTVYTYEQYDMVDISMLEVGDTIMIHNESVIVTEIERENQVVRINGGLDHGGYDLWTDDSGVYYETGYSDAKTWYAIGEVTLPVSQDFVFTDSADSENQSTTYKLDDLWGNDEVFAVSFTPHNTTIVIEDGVVTQMHRRYTP